MYLLVILLGHIYETPIKNFFYESKPYYLYKLCNDYFDNNNIEKFDLKILGYISLRR